MIIKIKAKAKLAIMPKEYFMKKISTPQKLTGWRRFN